ncbi:hypothetical protein C2G38_859191 [Gigaspora rosea]|uniref:Uncharacterized protein n=1 Tax=Gigaspora rosea TaxID=44941 RepID=A0A397TZ15_9GLOM|nr:hypothetical protein C2G38_859191 [Gigaspora rosea]
MSVLLYFTEWSQQKQKVRFDTNTQIEIFEIGDKVWIQRKELEASRLAKFKDKRFNAHLVLESGSSESHFKIQDLVDQAFVQDLAEALRIDGKSKDSIHLSNTPQAKRVRYGSYSNDDHDGRYYSANNGDYDNGDSEGGNDNNDNEDSDDEGCNDSKMVIL